MKLPDRSTMQKLAEVNEVPCNNPSYPRSTPAGHQTILMMTHTLGLLPPPRHHAVVCSAGSKGYCAVKEMLQNGVPGNTLLIESGDLRNVNVSSTNECCLVYTVDRTEHKYVDHIPTTVDHVILYSNCVCLPPSLLKNVGVVSIDLSPLSQVTKIQHCFLWGCTKLTGVDLSGLSQATEIHECFLVGCTGLSALDLSPLSQVTKVQHSFLWRCTGLTTLDLSPLSKVPELHYSFLRECTGLTAVDISGLSQVVEIHESFLHGCTKIAALDMSSLSQVTRIHGSFLKGCTNLTVVDNPPPCPRPREWAVSNTSTTTGGTQWRRK